MDESVTSKIMKQQIVDELHRSVRRNFDRRKTEIRGHNETFQADLVEMIPYAKENRNFKYILTVIDVFSKYAWAFPIKTKSAAETTSAMEKILKSGAVPKNIQTDMGKEFFNDKFKKLTKLYQINHYSTYSTKKAAIVERFNRTLKSKMWKMFSFNGSYQWVNMLKKLLDEYNNTVHRTTKMKPAEVNRSNEKDLLQTVYANKIVIRHRPKFKVGDYVRISKYKTIFSKGYTANWTTEIFRVRRVLYTDPFTYLLEDEHKNEVAGGFYEYEIQKTKYPNVFRVEKILRKKGDKVYVKWLGFDHSHNSWVNKENVM